jgi:polyisoprenyl-phosphate glycosyltransferase
MAQDPALLLSIVVPVYNEADVVDEFLRRLHGALADAGPYELVVVDDGSTDGTWERLLSHSVEDGRLRLIRLSRNFGHQIALTAGLDAARGQAIVTMDGDLQHPPEFIGTLLAKWREGYDVVHAVRATQAGGSGFKRLTARFFYRLFRRLASVDLPAQAGDFRLFSRRAADALARMPERARFLRGLASWIGFRQVSVVYQEDPRYAGTTKWLPRKMLRFGADAIVSFSTGPLKLVSALGFFVVGLCGLYLAYIVYARFFSDRTVQGWTSVIVALLLIGGIQLLSLGIVGQYIARIFDEAKGRPLYFVADVVEPASDEAVAEQETTAQERV